MLISADGEMDEGEELVDDSATRFERATGLLIQRPLLVRTHKGSLDDVHLDGPSEETGMARPQSFRRGMREKGRVYGPSNGPLSSAAAKDAPSISQEVRGAAFQRQAKTAHTQTGIAANPDTAKGLNMVKHKAGALGAAPYERPEGLLPRSTDAELCGRAPLRKTAPRQADVLASKAIFRTSFYTRSQRAAQASHGPNPLRLIKGHRKVGAVAAKPALAMKVSAGIGAVSFLLSFALAAFSMMAFAGLASTGEEERASGSPSEMVDAYLDKALSMAANDAIGYSMSSRCLNPDVDCSSFVYYSLLHAGYSEEDLGGSWPFTTSTMDPILTALGFEKHAFTSVSELVAGDILWKSSHTEIYIGGGQNVGAHSNYDGRRGDGSGREVCTGNCSSSWTCFYRLTSTDTQDDADRENSNGQR